MEILHQMNYYDYDEAPSLIGRIVSWAVISILFAPFVIGMYRLLRSIDLSIDDVIIWIEHPITRSVLAVAGGLLAWRLLRPLRRESRISALAHEPSIIANNVYLFVHREAGDAQKEEEASLLEYSAIEDEHSSLTISELGHEDLEHILRGYQDDSGEARDIYDYNAQGLEDRNAKPAANYRDSSTQAAIAASSRPDLRGALTIELVPKSCWFSNLRSALSTEQWSIIRKRVYRAANHQCQICGGRGERWPVEAHETWSYDSRNNVQRLESIRALCPACHEVKHFGLARIKGREQVAMKHLMKVNDWSAQQAHEHIRLSFEEWSQRSLFSWSIDLALLSTFGFTADHISQLEKLERQAGGVH